MTQAQLSGVFGTGFGGGLLGSVKRLLAVIATMIVGALVLMAAGVVAVSVMIVGMIITFVAMLLRAGAVRRAKASFKTTQSASPASDDGVLEAHRTAHGWTVDR